MPFYSHFALFCHIFYLLTSTIDKIKMPTGARAPWNIIQYYYESSIQRVKTLQTFQNKITKRRIPNIHTEETLYHNACMDKNLRFFRIASASRRPSFRTKKFAFRELWKNFRLFGIVACHMNKLEQQSLNLSQLFRCLKRTDNIIATRFRFFPRYRLSMSCCVSIGISDVFTFVNKALAVWTLTL